MSDQDEELRRGPRKGTHTVHFSRVYSDGSSGGPSGDPNSERVNIFGGRGGGGYGGGGYGGGGGGFGGGGGGSGFFGEDSGGHGGEGQYFGGGMRDITSSGSIYSLSEQEKKELGVAVLALSLAFSFAFIGGLGSLLYGLVSIGDYLQILLIAFVVVSTGFVLHELGHKFVAQRYGCWAEFRYSKAGLGMALLLSAVAGFLFAAPGAVMISGRISRRQNGIISAAGPVVNLILAYIFIGIFIAGIFMAGGGVIGGDFILLLGLYGIIINLILGLFNMIPFPPLDGSKIITWNKAVYIGLGLALGLTFLPFFIMIYLS